MKNNVAKVRAIFREYHCNHRNIIDKSFRENGIYFGQPPILKYLSGNDNATQKEIADFLHISPPSVATSLKRMADSGLVVRIADKKDARRNNLRLTEKGKKLSEYADNMFLKMDEATFSDFTDEEIEILIKFLERMNKNLADFAERGEENV
ncbi:MAG: winged helix-turn-helix transcriptional regulator [Clostridia bacterium]|nr:winged helix-turn-helix transcriptional regulator [Clostridia bacterium]